MDSLRFDLQLCRRKRCSTKSVFIGRVQIGHVQAGRHQDKDVHASHVQNSRAEKARAAIGCVQGGNYLETGSYEKLFSRFGWVAGDVPAVGSKLWGGSGALVSTLGL